MLALVIIEQLICNNRRDHRQSGKNKWDQYINVNINTFFLHFLYINAVSQALLNPTWA